jgi:hypothetical protein
LRLNSLQQERRVRTIRETLIWMVVIRVLPAWIGVATLIQRMYSSERERAVQAMIMTAQALMLVVDGELGAQRGRLCGRARQKNRLFCRAARPATDR